MKEKTLSNAIEAALKQFQSNDFYTQSLHLFETLGYNTERQTDDDHFEIDDIKDFFELETLDEKLFKEKVFYKQWASLQFLFQLTVEELHFKTPALFVEEATVEYQGKENYLFFALDLKPTNEDGQTYSRSKLAEITRRINRLSPTPVMILFRHDNHISFAIIDRRLSKKNNHEDVIERKVSIIKDINLVQPNRGHIEILHDLALPTLREKHEINTFLELHKAWKATLDLNLLNKKFYRELQNWYFWTLPQVKFPNDDPTKDEITRNAESVIRLITRIVFVWFLKEKDLVPKNLFDKNFIDGILAANKDNNSYYNAILQNLFFATLNRKMDERGFAIDKDFLKNKTEHSVYNLYRYEKLFTKDTDTILGYFKDIPFLNGGLFECLDTREGNKTIYIDGFSRNKAKRAQIPDFIFFAGETEADLSEFQGESKGSKYEKVRGLFNILNSYKFTVAENTPIEQEIALDPELLGQVFENLLAAYNPETKTSARKQTGSFYTPREIVDYMVDESLVAYLLQKFEERQQGVKTQLGKQQILLLASEQRGGQLELENNHALTEIQKQKLETKLRHLVAYGDEPHLFSREEAGFIVTALHEAKILDPACGSGAFPMGILLKMTHILNKIDPRNEQWKETEINNRLKPYLQDKKQIEAIGYEAARKAALEKIDDQIQAVRNAFDDNEADYARKLYLIENCIYGVDIQTIAVQISKLRFFISLVVHQKQDENKDNFGILPLPNLETKFVAANSLVKLERNEQLNLFITDEIVKKQKEISDNRSKIFSISNANQKKALQEKDKKLREALQNALDVEIKKEITNLQNRIVIRKEDLKVLEKALKVKEAKQLKQSKEDKKDTKIKQDIATIKKQMEALQLDIAKLETEIRRTELLKNTAKRIADWNPFDQNTTADFFEPRWMFLFKEGFDMVIGNPPYVQLQSRSEDEKTLFKKQGYNTYSPTGDIYEIFYERGVQVLKQNGLLCYITSNKWMRAKYGESTRRFFARHNPLQLIDFGGIQIFSSATVDTNILLLQKRDNQQKTVAAVINQKVTTTAALRQLVNDKHLILNQLSETTWNVGDAISTHIKQIMERVGTPLKDWDIEIYRGILTGYNDAFIINTQKRDELIAQDPASAEILKPILRGRDIKRYRAEWADLWLIHAHNGIKNNDPKTKKLQPYLVKPINVPQDYPAIKAHLDEHWDKLVKRQDKGDTPYNLRNCVYFEAFEKEKIIYPETTVGRGEFVFIGKSQYVDKTCFIITGEKIKYLSVLLSSKLFIYYMDNQARRLGKNSIQYSKQYLLETYVVNVPNDTIALFECLLSHLLYLYEQKERNEEWIKQVEEIANACVYELYFKEAVRAADAGVIEMVTPWVSLILDDAPEKMKLAKVLALKLRLSAFERENELSILKTGKGENSYRERIARQQLIPEIAYIEKQLSTTTSK